MYIVSIAPAQELEAQLGPEDGDEAKTASLSDHSEFCLYIHIKYHCSCTHNLYMCSYIIGTPKLDFNND